MALQICTSATSANVNATFSFNLRLVPSNYQRSVPLQRLRIISDRGDQTVQGNVKYSIVEPACYVSI